MNLRVTIQIVMVVMVAMNSISITSTIYASPTNESDENIGDSVISASLASPGRRYLYYDYKQFFNVFLCFILDKIYISETITDLVHELASSTSDIISTIAGTGASSFSGDNGAATSAAIYSPFAVALDVSGRPRHSISLRHYSDSD